MRQHLDIWVYGRVTGVNFRSAAAAMAEQLQLTGQAKNLDNHSVYLEAEGETAALQKFVAWCWQGSPWAKVERVETRPGKLKNYASFDILWN